MAFTPGTRLGIYQVTAQIGDVHALVIELVPGDDLSQRIVRGAIPLDEALRIAKQIAEALEAAIVAGSLLPKPYGVTQK